MHPGAYRTRLFLDLCRLLVLPSLVFSAFTYTYDIHLGFLLAIPCHIAFIITWAFCKGVIMRLICAQDSYRMGAKEIPCVVGKWPGNIDVLLKMMKAFKTSYILDVYLRLFEEYQCTTLNTRILWSDMIITMDQEHAKFVTSTGFHHFWRGKYQKERMEKFLGQGIFNRDDEMWRMHRSNTRPFFARERISDFETFERYSSKTLGIISSLDATNRPFDAQDLFSRFTLDAASEFLFGKNLDTLSASLPTPGKTSMSPKGSATEDSWGSFAHAFEKAQEVVTARARLGYFWPLFELLGDKNAKNAKVIHDWVEPLVNEALSEKARMQKAGVTSPIADKNFLQHLTDSTDDPVIIRDQLLSLLLASRDTTACLLTYVTYFMAIYPDVAQKLRQEVLQHCGANDAPSYEQIRDLKYMRAVLNETLRLFPPVPLNVRESRAACTLPPSDPTFTSDNRPLYMPSATPIMYFPLLIQRNPTLWGSDADTFNPERWLDQERIAHFVKNPTIFTPFSAGPRMCIGQNYAYNEASYFLVKLLQRYDSFTLATEVQPTGSLPPSEWQERRGRQREEKIWPASALTLFVKGGLWVRFHKAHL
uniref:Putative cytochrome P450 monooxygenase CYP63 n=1 Tax=Moniliophthora roreri TaxID=221103 RepID=A0A0W0ETJ6_MONRR